MIVVPYGPTIETWKFKATISALRADDLSAMPYFCEGDFDLYEMLHDLWERAETFVMVEHDIVVWPGAVKALVECPEPWCAYPYKIGGHYSPAHGCVKYEGEFMAAHPGVMEQMSRETWSSGGDPRIWRGMDSRVALTLANVAGRGSPHHHGPPVTHLNQEHWKPGGSRPKDRSTHDGEGR